MHWRSSTEHEAPTRRVATRAARGGIAAGVSAALASGCIYGTPGWGVSVRNDCDIAIVPDSQDSGWEEELAPGEVSNGDIGLAKDWDESTDRFEDSPTAKLWFKIRLPGSDTQVGVFIAEPSDYVKDTSPGAADGDYILPIGGDACP